MGVTTADKIADALIGIGKELDRLKVPQSVFIQQVSHEEDVGGKITRLVVRVHWEHPTRGEFACRSAIGIPFGTKKSPWIHPLVVRLVSQDILRKFLHIRESVDPCN